METTNNHLAWNGEALDIEIECRIWDWVRAAGLSEQELREAVREFLSGPQEPA